MAASINIKLLVAAAVVPTAHALVIGGAASARPRTARASDVVALDFLKQFLPKDRPTDAEVTDTVYFDSKSTLRLFEPRAARASTLM